MFSSVLKSALLLLMLGLSGCASSPSAQFYLLEPLAEASSDGAAIKQPLVLSPVRMPHYLDRAQIVTAIGDNRYQISEYDRWAESLDQNVQRVLQQDLSRLLSTEVVAAVPVGTHALKLNVSVLTFHVDPHGQAKLVAQWQIQREQTIVTSHQQDYQEAVNTDDYVAKVAALNRCLNRLSRDLADSVKASSAVIP